MLRIAPVGAAITVTDAAGERVYVPVHDTSAADAAAEVTELHLAGVPIATMRREGEAELHRKAVEAAVRADEGVTEDDPSTAGLGRPGNVDMQMWVDKYRPRQFTDLISDGTINRVRQRFFNGAAFDCLAFRISPTNIQLTI